MSTATSCSTPTDYQVNKAGFVIHSAVHMARHDAACVAHTHTPAGMAVSAMECGLLPLAQTSMRFCTSAITTSKASPTTSRARAARAAPRQPRSDDPAQPRPSGHRPRRAGGVQVLYRLERACEVQVMAMAANTKLVLPSKEILEETYDKMQPKPEAATATAALPGARCCASSTGSTPRTAN